MLNSLHLSADEDYAVYGKTGTGKINGKEQNGWFIGILEKEGEPYFFSVHIEGKDDASGKTASEIRLLRLTETFPSMTLLLLNLSRRLIFIYFLHSISAILHPLVWECKQEFGCLQRAGVH